MSTIVTRELRVRTAFEISTHFKITEQTKRKMSGIPKFTWQGAPGAEVGERAQEQRYQI